MKNGKFAKRGVATKVMLVILAVMLVAGISVGGTLAWLSAKSETVVNTFTYGDINIKLEETTTDYKMVPGNKIAKDPKVTVEAPSEDCWLFVEIVKSENYSTYLENYTVATGWTALTGHDGVYYREAKEGDSFYVLGAAEGMPNGHVQVKTSVTKAQMVAIKESGMPTLTFTAYAVQKDNVASAADAWALAKP